MIIIILHKFHQRENGEREPRQADKRQGMGRRAGGCGEPAAEVNGMRAAVLSLHFSTRQMSTVECQFWRLVHGRSSTMAAAFTVAH